MANNAFDYPAEAPIADAQGFVAMPWLQTFQRWHAVVLALQQSGVTAQRPTSVLWIGRRFYDTTLNKPVWVSAVKPAVVWRDAAGGVV